MVALVGWAMIVLSAVVLVTTFPGRGHHVIAPGLLPVFGTAFGAAYLAAQAGVAAWLKSRRAAIILVGVFALGAALAGVGRSLDLFGTMSKHGMGFARQIMVGGAVFSGLALGVAMARGYVDRQRSRDR